MNLSDLSSASRKTIAGHRLKRYEEDSHDREREATQFAGITAPQDLADMEFSKVLIYRISLLLYSKPILQKYLEKYPFPY